MDRKSLPVPDSAKSQRRLFATVVAKVAQQILHRIPETLPIAIKLALVIGLLITLIMGLLGALLVYNQSRIMGDQIAMSGRSMALQLAEAAKEPTLASDQLALSVLVNNLTSGGTTVFGAAVLDETGILLSQAGALPLATEQTTPALWPLLTGETREHEWLWQAPDHSNVEVVTYATPLRFEEIIAGYSLVTLNRSLMNQSLYDLMRTVAVATLVMVLLGFVLSFFLARHLSRPIMDLVDAGRAMKEGGYQFRISERRNDEIGNLITAFNSMADGMLQKAQVEDAFSRYVSPTVARNVLANLGNVRLGGQRIDGSILFADIAGFTSLSEQMKPEQVAELLNEYFYYIARASSVYNGTLDKYIGDCAMIVFGVPEADPEHSFKAVACATLIRAVVKRLNERRRACGKRTVEFRFGLNAGQMLAGNMGSRDRMQYTVVGDTVNIAARLCTYADAGHIVISRELYMRPPIFKHLAAHEYREIQVRGKTDPVAIYEVDGLTEPYNNDIEHQADELVNGITEPYNSDIEHQADELVNGITEPYNSDIEHQPDELVSRHLWPLGQP